MRVPWRVLAALALIWVIALVVIFWMRAVRPTSASLATYIHTHSLVDLPPAERARVIDHVAGQLNRLDFDEREALRRTRADRAIFDQMTPDERQKFLDRTLPEGFHQIMIALNNMDPEKRKRFVHHTLDQLERDDPEIGARLPADQVQKIIEKGMQSFYNDANANVKLDFAPVIEQLQRNTQQ